MQQLQQKAVKRIGVRHAIKSMPGNFSGLAAVCHMYVAGKLIMPEHDFGFDLADEYQAAQLLLPGA